MPETLEHYLHDCNDVTEANDSLINNVEDVLIRENLQKSVIDLVVL